MNIVSRTSASENATTDLNSSQASEIQQTEHQTSHIVLSPETITHLGPLPITNTMITGYLVMATLIIISLLATRKMKLVPTGLQNIAESVVEALHNLTQDVAHDKTKVFFPLIATFFLFILISNWFGLLPGMGTIGFYEVTGPESQSDKLIPLLRSTNSDLNITLGLALISAAATHYYAVKYLGLGGYLKKWFALNPIMLFVGLLELVSEFTKIISLSFRLFGNIFAGEVVLTTISGLFAFIAPLPFYMLEVLVGVVQAAVFMMLTLVFMVVLSERHDTH